MDNAYPISMGTSGNQARKSNMTENIKKLAWLPDVIREPLVKLDNNYRQAMLKRMKQRALKGALRNFPLKRIIVGGATTQYEGWIPADKESLNLLVESDWTDYFESNSLDAILAEHVWEHLTRDEAVVAVTNCYLFLKPGGYLHIAVPDGLHPDVDCMPRLGWAVQGGERMTIKSYITTAHFRHYLKTQDIKSGCWKGLTSMENFIRKIGMPTKGLSSALPVLTCAIAPTPRYIFR